MSNFHPLEIVDRGSETQPHVGRNLNNIRDFFLVVEFDWKCDTRVFMRLGN